MKTNHSLLFAHKENKKVMSIFFIFCHLEVVLFNQKNDYFLLQFFVNIHKRKLNFLIQSYLQENNLNLKFYQPNKNYVRWSFMYSFKITKHRKGIKQLFSGRPQITSRILDAFDSPSSYLYTSSQNILLSPLKPLNINSTIGNYFTKQLKYLI